MADSFTSQLGTNASQPGTLTPGDTNTQPPSQPGYYPTLDDVAALVRARTKVQGGRTLGEFSDLTSPRADQVQVLIAEAADEVTGKVQPVDYTLPPGTSYNAPGSDYERRIRRAIALYTAILLELSYYPEQTQNGQSPVAVYQQLYASRLSALIAEGELGHPGGMGGGSGGGGDAPGDASWSFPDAAPGALVGWQSRWSPA